MSDPNQLDCLCYWTGEPGASWRRRAWMGLRARASLLTLGVGGVFAVVFGAVGYQFRPDIVGVFMGQILFGTMLLPVALIWQYFHARPGDDKSS